MVGLSLICCDLAYAGKKPSTSALFSVPSCTPVNAPGANCNTPNATLDQVASCAVNNILPVNLECGMVDFQNITNNNPDSTFALFGSDYYGLTPPGSRDSGTSGDIASVNYMKSKLQSYGYDVTVQTYPVPYSADLVVPVMNEISGTNFVAGVDFSSATFSGSGDVTAPLQTLLTSAPTAAPSILGCAARDFANFKPGNIALLQRGKCANRDKVLNAIAAGAVGVITMNYDDSNAGNTLQSADGMTVPVFAYTKLSAGQNLYNYATTNPNPMVRMNAQITNETRNTYNVIGDSKFGNPSSVVVIGGHYDSIFGAGMIDNASGTVSILEIARVMAKTPTTNKLRVALWGGEELGTFGSNFYVNTLAPVELNKISYYLDIDDAATNNYAFILDDPIYAIKNPSGAVTDANKWKTNAVNLSTVGNDYYKNFLTNNKQGYSLTLADLYISGSDTDPFILAGIPIAGIATGQGSGKTSAEVKLFGGVAGNYDMCVDTPYIFCDNLCNTSYFSPAYCPNASNPPFYPYIFNPDNNPHTIVTKASTDATVRLLFNPNLGNNGQHTATGQKSSPMTRKYAP